MSTVPTVSTVPTISTRSTMSGIAIMIAHLIVVFIVGTTVMISTNKYVLLLLFAGVALIYLQTLILDGCIASKIEGTIPFIGVRANDIVLAFFGLLPQDISIPNLEKILVGFTLFFVGVKLGTILMFEYIYNQTFYNQMCIFLNSRKNWYEKLLSCYV